MKLISEEQIREELNNNPNFKVSTDEKKYFYEITNERYSASVHFNFNDRIHVKIHEVIDETRVSYVVYGKHKINKKTLKYLDTYNGCEYSVYEDINSLVEALWMRLNKQIIITNLQGCKDYELFKRIEKALEE